ncbi:MAG: AMP-dependent synthetase [Proteobacteria bacterium]|nr:MAG: AMP-dependent synthetase [Pseudomonadota bacterium]
MRLIEPDQRNFDEIYASFRWEIPTHYNIAYEVCDKHRQRSNDIALFYENDRGDTKSFTFGQIKSLSDRFANALRALGVSRGDRVAIILSQRVETGIAHLAIYKIGAIALPLSILFGHDALEYRLRDSGAKVVITGTSHSDMLADMKQQLPDLDVIIGCDDAQGRMGFWPLLEKARDSLQAVNTGADDPALLIYTSGTTGPPKGALAAHRSLLGNLPGFELSQNFFPREDDVFWTPADWAWTGGLMDGLLPSWYYGRPILAYEGGKFDAERVCHLLEKYKVKNAFIPPTALKMMRQIPDISSRFKLAFRSIMSAGETLGEELFRWAEDALRVSVNEMWGQTEFNYLVGNCSEIMPVKPGSMGKPYPGHSIGVIDGEGQPMPIGEPGELAARIDDPVMFLNYWGKEEATREKFIGEWFCTGDIGHWDDDGYLWFVGRKDDVISSAGYRIGPGEIEDCLLKHAAVAQAAVIGSPDELRGSIVKAFIVLAKSYEPTDELKTDIQASVRTRLAAYEYPREIEFIKEVPMTTTGKVRRMELRQRDLDSKLGRG